MQINLSKHHGLGNDFLVINIAQADATFRWPELAQRWCDRRFGVGADGLLLLEIKAGNRLGMVLYNADGSRAEMSGNGIRCLVQAHR
jgi:diaminopimelate epimerase